MYTSAHGGVAQTVIYPVLEVRLTYATDGRVREWTISECCFHDLYDTDEDELAGMGLAILGNLVKTVGRSVYDAALGAELLLKRHPKDQGIACPWPGLADDRPVPLDLVEMPWSTEMFLDSDQFKYRLDRLRCMARIREVWVPWLKAQMRSDA